MKTIFSIILCITIFLIFPLTVDAEESNNLVRSDYTTTGCYYEVFEVTTDFPAYDARNIGDTIIVTREFLYYEILVPSSQINYHETINNTSYAGILNLSRFYFEDGKTYAVYTGTLTVVREN